MNNNTTSSETTQPPQHILSTEGILTTFSIAKRVTSENVRNINEKLKVTKEKESIAKLQHLLKKAIIKETKNALETKKIPGLITEDEKDDNQDKKRLMELSYFSNIIAKKINDKNLNKFYRCYIINTLVNGLHLSEEDFEDFHRKFSEFLENNNDGECGNND